MKYFSPLNFLCFIIVALTGLALSFSAKAETISVPFSPVTVMYLIKDPDSPMGYKERLRWSINTSADWDRFYKNMPGLPIDKTINPDPLKTKVDDMIVLSRKDSNKLTGFDIYLSSNGIMSVQREATHSYFPDSNKLWEFLQEEQKLNASFSSFSDGKVINPKTFGIVATYNINRNIANPTWLIDSKDKIAIYDSFFMTLKPYTSFELQFSAPRQSYDDIGVFILNLNYPKAPAKIATVTPNTIRFSNSFISTKFYQDPDNYYSFYKSQAREMMNYNNKYGNVKDVDERQF